MDDQTLAGLLPSLLELWGIDQTGIADDPEHNRDALTRARRGIEEV